VANVTQAAKTVRGAVTIARRRGLGYYWYLLGGVAVPRILYRWVWGPTAPRPMKKVFASVTPLFTRPSTAAELETLGLISDSANPTPATEVPVEEIERLLDRAHASGVTGVANSFDRLTRHADGTLRFISLPGSRIHTKRGAHFSADRDWDRVAFNNAFGTSLLTERTARRALQSLKGRVPLGYRHYAPIDFGGGLGLGRVAVTDSGTGRWEFFNRHVVAPLVAGKRVLDLGSNNGSLPLMMLREGARQVVAVEGTPEIADLARLNGRILQWRDIKQYDLRVITGDMRLFLVQDLGPFDVVTAFCSLYYLPEQDMARVIAHAAAMGATLVLQANEAIGNNLPGRTTDLQRLMQENGYPHPRVYAPDGFARPLLVAEPSVSAAQITAHWREHAARKARDRF
jgi:hypothetical protein